MGTQLGQLVADLIQSADLKPRTDFELLDDFVRRGDVRAFETLVRRHGPAVLATCQKVLPGADSDDAFQAAFIALIRHAPHIRTAIGGWLVVVAHRIAVRMRAASQRRVAIEAKYNGPGNDMSDPSWREACAILHQELDALPEHYRRPLVLCYLSGLARDEAAKELGLTLDTIKGRLERGRLRLRRRLAKRGVTLSVGLLGAVAARGSAAIPTQLARAAVASAIRPSPALAALVQNLSNAGVWPLRTIGISLAATVLAIGFALGWPEPSPSRELPKTEQSDANDPAPAKAKSPAAKPPAEKMWTITGMVVDPDGKPVAGAELVLFPIAGKPTVAGKSDTDGKFQVETSLMSDGEWLFAHVPGFGSNYLMPATNTPDKFTFKLVKDAPIRGRVIDTQGKPIANATIDIERMAGVEEKSLDGFLAGWLKRDSLSQDIDAKGAVYWDESGSRRLPDGRAIYAARTDAAGRFEIANIGSERIVTLSIRAAGMARSQVLVVARKGFNPKDYNKVSEANSMADKDGLSYHPTFDSPTPEIVLEAEKPIRGTVTDADSGKPLAGIRLRLTQGWRLRLPELSATTDANGHYEIHGAKKAASYELRVNRDVKAVFLGRTVKFLDRPAYEPIEANMTLAKGIVLTGRVLDTSTGKPVSGFACIGILSDNEFVKSRPEYSSPDCYDFAYTGKDGRYRTIVPPGAILLMGGPMPGPVDGEQPYFRYRQLRPDPDYPQYFSKNVLAFHSTGGSFMMMQGMYCKVLKLKPDQKEYTADVLITPASRFRVKIQDAEGKPLKGASVAGNTSRDWMFPQVCKDDTCIVYELENAKPRLLAFHAPGGQLVGVLTLKGSEKEPAIVRLGPTARVKGKIVNQAGQPTVNLRLQVGYMDRAVGEINGSRNESSGEKGKPIITDANGQFEIDDVIPGAQFLIYGKKGARFLEPPKNNRDAAYIAKPGEQVDLGTITLKMD